MKNINLKLVDLTKYHIAMQRKSVPASESLKIRIISPLRNTIKNKFFKLKYDLNTMKQKTNRAGLKKLYDFDEKDFWFYSYSRGSFPVLSSRFVRFSSTTILFARFDIFYFICVHTNDGRPSRLSGSYWNFPLDTVSTSVSWRITLVERDTSDVADK